MPKVSVILTVYNGMDTLPKCLDSIVDQTLSDIEIICVNDGSTDTTLDILTKYAAQDERIVIVDQPNAGAGAARNAGMALATGEYLSFLDADDFFERDMLRVAYNQAVADDVDFIVFGSDLYQGKEVLPCDFSIQTKLLPKKSVFSTQDVRRDVFKLFVGWAWDKLFKASFVREHKLYFQEQRSTNDMLFVFSAMICARKICVNRSVLAHHTSSPGTISATREKSWPCFYHALIALRENLVSWNLFERFKQDYINYCVHFSLWNLNTLKEPARTQLAEILREKWFDELGVTEYPRSYFYNGYEYNCYKRIYTENNSLKFERENLILRGWRCFREHSIMYTAKKILGKIGVFFR